MEKMLVTQGLNELKTLEARIDRAIGNASFVAAAKTCEKNVNPALSKEKFTEDAKASYQSVTDLMARRARIKAAVVDSNARTKVEICGEEMTVAKAIDLKKSIESRKELLRVMKNQRDAALSLMNRKNAEMEGRIDSLVATAFGKESKTKINEEDYDSISVPYRKSNEYSLVDPLGIEAMIRKEEEYIEEFESTVDQKLQVSNCVTFIEI